MTVTASSRMGAAAMPIAMVPKTCSSTFSSAEASSGAMKKGPQQRTLPVSCRCLVAPASPAQARIRHSMRSGSSFMGGSLTYLISARSFKRDQGRRNSQLIVKADADYYSVLGVSKGADKAEIKSSYRRLARQFHPDVNKEAGAEQKFKDISNAYEVLSDDEKRSLYDRFGEAGLKGAGQGGPGDFNNPFDLFETFFGSMGGMGGMGGSRQARSRPMQGLCLSERSQELPVAFNRREAMGLCGLAATLSLFPCNDKTAVNAAGLPEEEKPRICDVDCEKDLDKIPTETTPSGLQYKDILVGKGPSPLKGFQVAANYVAMIPTGKVFDSSLDKGLPYIFRVGSGQILQGLDEGILTMKVGGIRRLYIPGQLAFPKGLNSAAGRPRVPPASPVIFDVNLLYIPGLEDELPGEESPAPSSEISLELGDGAEDKTDL